ncbi:MAG: hypothetical protein ACFFCK_03975 [Promethearchaeota archaeon]
MLLSIIVGVAFRKYLPENRDYLIRAQVIGLVLGLLGHLGLVYPFFVSVDRELITIPEVTAFGFYFVLPSLKLFSYTLPFDYPFAIGPPLVTLLFVIISLMGVMIGYRIGPRKKGEDLWPSD